MCDIIVTLSLNRYCDNVWTCLVQDVELKETQAADVVYVNKVKIVACDANNSSGAGSKAVKS